MLTHLFRNQIGLAPAMVTTCNRVHLIGAGGNGAPMLMRLHKMHTTLCALGRHGLNVTVWDHDAVSPSNIGRQPYYSNDIGKNKAELLVNRLKAIDPSIADWQANARKFTDADRLGHDTLVVITCVDTKQARRAVHHAVHETQRALYWLDMGNEANTGQVVLGECHWPNRKLRLPVVTEIYPEILDESIPEDDVPSCSTAEAIAKQSLFINELVVGHASNLLWQGIHEGRITHPILYINSHDHLVHPVGIDPAFYRRKGLKPMMGRKNPHIADI